MLDFACAATSHLFTEERRRVACIPVDARVIGAQSVAHDENDVPLACVGRRLIFDALGRLRQVQRSRPLQIVALASSRLVREDRDAEWLATARG